MSLSIAIGSGKGGTGKTFLTANLGVALASFGRDVILLDADLELPSLELHVGLEGMKVTLNDVLAGRAEVDSVIYNAPGGVRVVPAGISLYKLRKVDLASLGDIFEELRSKAEMLLIDVPPGIGGDVVATLAASRQLILVVIPSFPAMPASFKTIQVAKNLGTEVLGVVINRATMDENDLTIREVEDILEQKVIGVIPEDPQVKKSVASGTPHLLDVPDSPASLAIKKLAADLIGVDYEIPQSRVKSFIDRMMRR
jgi:septum site-determining protein MinD